METLDFKVSLIFEDKIVDDNEIAEIAKNIANALKHEANTAGLAPEESETFTRKIVVSIDDFTCEMKIL